MEEEQFYGLINEIFKSILVLQDDFRTLPDPEHAQMYAHATLELAQAAKILSEINIKE